MRKIPRKNDDVHNGFGEWGGYMDAKKSKLEEQFAEDTLKNPYKVSNLFTGISIFVNGLTNPSAEELKRLMMTHGGVYHTYQKSATTFIIANNLPDVKIRQITTAKIISPQWIVDCLNAKKILDYSNYLLYTNCKISQPKIAFKEDKVQITTATAESIGKTNDEVNFEPSIIVNLDILNTAIRREENCETNKMHKMEVAAKGNEAKYEMKKVQTKTAVDPNFLSEFYNNSRLHHIATLGTSFKQFISQLRDTHNGRFPTLYKLKKVMHMNQANRIDKITGKHVIMHIDMDCFFVSVGLRRREHLKGFPIAVTHSKAYSGNNIQSINGADRKKEIELYVKRHEEKHKINENENDRIKTMSLIDSTTSLSEIASCSYEARKVGIKNGMFVGAAMKLCPQLKTIPYDFVAYKEVAQILYDIITRYTLDIEAVSCDEMYVNLSSVLQTLECSVDEFVSHIRNEIMENTKCPCSAGIGENKLQARMATKNAKPNRQFHLEAEKVEEFFSDILISDLPGVGYSTTQKCNNLGLKKCVDLQQVSLVKLQQEFGRKLGEKLYQNCRGVDNKPLIYDQIRKSVSAEVNYGIRFTTEEQLSNFLYQLCAEVQHRLVEISAKGKTITLKYMVRAKDAPIETAKFMGHGFCDNITKSVTLAAYTCDLPLISETVFNIKKQLKVPPQELRGIGIQISKLNKSQSNTSKDNSLKNMFSKVQTKQDLQSLNAVTSVGQMKNSRESTSYVQSKRKVKFPNLRKVKSSNDILAHEVIEASEWKDFREKMYETYDLSVLAELPSEIQQEILLDNGTNLKEYSNKCWQQGRTSKKALARKLENDFQNIDMNKKHKNEVKVYQKSSSACVSKENILNSNEWRQILLNWIENSTEPEKCDIRAILKFFTEFACKQQLYEVALAFKFLHRKTGKMDCKWHRIYKMMIDEVQNEIQNIFGAYVTLCSKDFDCKNCINILRK